MTYLISAIVGSVLALLVSSFLFHGNVYSLIVWGVEGLLIGLFAKSRKEGVISGALYGFILSFMFMVLGYKGARPLISVTPFFALLGLFGALCGLVLGFIGYILKGLKKK